MLGTLEACSYVARWVQLLKRLGFGVSQWFLQQPLPREQRTAELAQLHAQRSRQQQGQGPAAAATAPLP